MKIAIVVGATSGIGVGIHVNTPIVVPPPHFYAKQAATHAGQSGVCRRLNCTPSALGRLQI